MKGTNIGEFEEIVLLMVSILEDEAYVLRMKQEMYIPRRKVTKHGAGPQASERRYHDNGGHQKNQNVV